VLGHLAAFATAVANGPGLLVMTSRVEGDPLDAAWRASCRGTPFATIDLGPLRGDEALSLAGSFIDATHSVALACIERSGGNPLFLEQLLHNAEEGKEDAVPASIQSLVLARMDRLAQRDRQAFQAAAVTGQRFDLALLRHLIDKPDYVCDGLISNALVLPEGDDFLFAHALIQEGAILPCCDLVAGNCTFRLRSGSRTKTLRCTHNTSTAPRMPVPPARTSERPALSARPFMSMPHSGWLIAAWKLRRPMATVTPLSASRVNCSAISEISLRPLRPIGWR
jgi:hypothetical protein